MARKSGRSLDAGRREKRRKYVDVPAKRVVAAGCHETRPPEDQRNMQRRLVGEETVRLLAVIPQRLAMVRSENEKRRPPRDPKVLEEGAERLVDPRHLAQVRLGRE